MAFVVKIDLLIFCTKEILSNQNIRFIRITQ